MKRLFAALLSISCCAIPASAQADRAVLTGTVTDPSGASVTGVHVELTETGTGLRRETLTMESGSYTLGSLPVGVYRAIFRSPSFQVVQYDSLSLLVGENRTLNVQLQLASTAQEAHIEASVSPLAETGAELGGVVGTRQLENLPLNGRSW